MLARADRVNRLVSCPLLALSRHCVVCCTCPLLAHSGRIVAFLFPTTSLVSDLAGDLALSKSPWSSRFVVGAVQGIGSYGSTGTHPK